MCSECLSDAAAGPYVEQKVSRPTKGQSKGISDHFDKQKGRSHLWPRPSDNSPDVRLPAHLTYDKLRM